jgi:hypothetical protein
MTMGNPDPRPNVPLPPRRRADFLLPEAPIGAFRSRRRRRDAAPGPDAGRRNTGPHPGAGFGGTVLNSVAPSTASPYLTLDVRTDHGETVAVRTRFLLPFRVPYIAAGHRVRIVGAVTRHGYIRPDAIENQTTGVRWRRLRRRWVVLIAVLAVVSAVIVIAGPLHGTGAPPLRMVTIPSIVGQPLDEALAELHGAGVENISEVRERSSAAYFTVLRTAPPPGSTIAVTAPVTVYFSFPM